MRLILADGTNLEDVGIALIDSAGLLAGLQVDYTAQGTWL
jgi:hypothetical protein